MRNWKKRFLAMITCVVFALMSSTIVSATEKMDIPDESGTAFVLAEIPGDLDGDAVRKEMELIDTLAQKYYDYFCEYGEFPDEGALPVAQSISMETYSVTEQSSLATDMLYAAAVDASIVNQFGYAFTASAVAMHLAEIGSAIAMSSALPYVALICAVTGATILTVSAAVAVANHVGKFQDTTTKYYSKSATYIATCATTTKDVAELFNRGYIYWSCTRREAYINGKKVGGINLASTLTKSEAQTIIWREDPVFDIYCLTNSYARELALSITGNVNCIYAEVDTNKGEEIYNLKHYHMLKKPNDKSTKYPTHIFFTY